MMVACRDRPAVLANKRVPHFLQPVWYHLNNLGLADEKPGFCRFAYRKTWFLSPELLTRYPVCLG